MILPRYITAIRSETWRTTARSWAMNMYERPELVLEVVEQVDDLGLDRHVEGRYRLVEHDQPWIDSQRPRHTDPLALPAGELVGEPVDVLGVQAHPLQQLTHALVPRPSMPCRRIGVPTI